MLSPQATIEPAELETGLKRLVVEALFSNTTAALTTGVVLTAFALHLGANNATIGLLAAIPFLTQLAQIPAIALVERVRERKRIAVLSSAFGRTMLGVMALAPFAGALGLPIMIVATIILCAMGAIGGCAWNSWIRDLAPEDRMGRILARRCRQRASRGTWRRGSAPPPPPAPRAKTPPSLRASEAGRGDGRAGQAGALARPPRWTCPPRTAR